MEISSKHQLFVFVLCVISGIGCGLFFDIQRSIRRVFSAGRIRTAAEDFFFVMVCIVTTIASGFYFNRGEIRYYQVMGLISGALFYGAFLSRITMRFLLWLYKFITKYFLHPLAMVFKAVIYPVIRIIKLTRKKIKKINGMRRRVFLMAKVREKQLKKRMKML